VTERPVVDVGVVTWNTRDLTVKALRHLLDTDQGCELRLLVRDNGSEDGTPEALAAEVPEAEVDAGRQNLGFAAGMNTLLARSTAPWFLALNSDAWPEPGAIRRLVEVATAHPRTAAVAPRLERPDGSLEHSTHPFPSLRVATITSLGLPRVLGARRADALMLNGWWDHDRPREVDWAVGAALLMRADALADVGGFDERFFMYVEDLEWCWRARQRGWEIRFEPSSLVRHVGNASGERRFGDTRTATYMANTYRWYRGERGAVPAAAYRALNVAGCLRLAALARLRRDRPGEAYWRATARANLARGTEG
jgi:GT2 family glycosyltransferase